MSSITPVDDVKDFNVYPGPNESFGGSLDGTSANGDGADLTVIGVSTTDGNFTAVPQDGTAVTVDGSYESFTVDSNGDLTNGLLETPQQTADAINANDLTSTTGPLSDTLYYEVQDSQGDTAIDSVTYTYGDVDVDVPSNLQGSVTDAPGETVSLAGIDVSKYLSDDGNTVAVDPKLSVDITAFDFGQQAAHGTFAVDSSVASANGSEVTVSDGGIVITGSESAINADLSSLTYTGTQAGDYALGIQTTDDSYVASPGYVSADYLYGTLDVNCFRSGTRIRTVRGEVAIEHLSPGDAVVIARIGGESTQKVTWVGHRGIDCTRHPKPETVWPVRICKDAFAAGQPVRDLWLSPGHSVYAEGVLMQIEKLVNGTTIRQERCDQVDYWHVELEHHDILFAEGLPAESYLETGNRAAFIGGGKSLELHPDFRPKHWSQTCVPLIFGGDEMRRTRAMLIGRALESGYSITADDDVHVMADDCRVEAVRLGSDRVAFLLPENCSSVVLRSNTFVPAHHDASSDDRRTLGLCVGSLQVDGVDVELADEAALAVEGWHGVERQNDQCHRWTNGNTAFPPGTRLLVVGFTGRGYFWNVGNATPAKPMDVARFALVG